MSGGNAVVVHNEIRDGAFSWRVSKPAQAVETMGLLPDARCGLYLLQWSCNAGRVSDMARTPPPGAPAVAFSQFDESVRSAVASLTGLRFDGKSWTQACLARKKGGLGVRSAAKTADATDVASCATARKLCIANWPNHPEDQLG